MHVINWIFHNKDGTMKPSQSLLVTNEREPGTRIGSYCTCMYKVYVSIDIHSTGDFPMEWTMEWTMNFCVQ